MPKLKFNERQSEYSPIVVEIDEKEYTVREIDKEVVRELQKYDEILESDLMAPYRRLAFLLNLKENDKIFDKMHPRKVNRITNSIIRAIYSADAAEMQNLTPSEKKKKSSGVKDRKQ